MTLSSDDIILHMRLLHSYQAQADEAIQRLEDAERDLWLIGCAISNEKTILRSEGVDI